MKEILTVLFRRQSHAIWFFAFMVGIPVLLSYVLPPKYESKATLLLTAGREKKPFVPNEKDSRTPLMQVSMEDVGSEVELLLSRPVLEAVVDKNHLERDCGGDGRSPVAWSCAVSRGLHRLLVATGLSAEVPAREAAIDRLHDRLNVEYLKRTNIISVRWRAASPGLARDVVNSVVEAYLAHHISVYTNAYALDAIQKEVDEGRARLEAAQTHLSAYSAARSISNLDKQRSELLGRLSEAESKVGILEGMKDKELPTGEIGNLAGDPAFLELSKRLTDAELRKIDLSFKYKPDSWQVVAVNQEIDQLHKLVHDRQQSNLDRWRGLAETYRGELRRLDQAKLEFDRLQREIDDLSDRDRLGREKLHEVLISQEMDRAAIASVKVVEYAVASSDPAFPRRPLILAVSILLGLVGGVTWAFAVDRMVGTVTSIAEAEKATGGPVLASIPEYAREAAGAADGFAGGFRRDLIPVEKVLSRNGSAPARTLLVTSPSAGAGTTLVARGIARAAAGTSGASVLLLALRPRTGAPAAGGTGLAPARALERLRGADPAAPRAGSGIAAAAGQPAGEPFDTLTIDVGPADLQGDGERFEAILQAARQKYVSVVVDVAGRGGDPLYLRVVPLVDAVVLVAAYDRTGRQPLSRMAEVVRRHGGRVAGCVLNRRRHVIPQFLYERLSR